MILTTNPITPKITDRSKKESAFSMPMVTYDNSETKIAPIKYPITMIFCNYSGSLTSISCVRT